MLHILLLILKIIGIILAVIVGILILLIGIVLLVPIRYEITAKCDGTLETLKAKGKATWLLHLLRGDVFVKGKVVKWKARLAWMKKSNTSVFSERKEEEKDETTESKPQVVDETVTETKENEKIEKVSDGRPEEHREVLEEKRKENSSQNKKSQIEKPKEDKPKKEKPKKEKPKKKKEKKPVGETIQKTIDSVKEKIKELLDKKDKVMNLITNQAHIHALKKLKKALFVLLKRLKPKKTDIKLRLGFEDPCTTGQVLAVLGILYPVIGSSTDIVPDFENQVLKGTVYLKGKIRLWHFAVLAIRLLLCKDVRTTYKDIRNFKL